MSPQLKLTYFHGTGRAEITRLLFHFGGVAFEDKRIGHADIGSIKSTLPLGQLPVLEVEGVTYAQSMAIDRYAAKVSGLFNQDPLEALGADMILETLNDMDNPMGEIVFATRDPALKAQKTKTYLEATLPKSLSVLETKVQGKCFLGDKASYVGAQLFGLFSGIKTTFADADLSAYPKLLAVADLVKTNAGIAAYMASQSP